MAEAGAPDETNQVDVASDEATTVMIAKGVPGEGALTEGVDAPVASPEATVMAPDASEQSAGLVAPVPQVGPEHAQAEQAAHAEAAALGVTLEQLEQMRAEEVAFSWQASEYVHHHKGAGWYATLAALIVALVAAGVIFHAWLTIALFAVMGAAIAVYAHKPPRVLTYELSPKGIRIEGKDYAFEVFRSFGVIRGSEWHAIDLEPAKRLMPRLTVLFTDEDFESIVGHLELHLPRVDRDPDFVERLTQYLRF